MRGWVTGLAVVGQWVVASDTHSLQVLDNYVNGLSADYEDVPDFGEEEAEWDVAGAALDGTWLAYAAVRGLGLGVANVQGRSEACRVDLAGSDSVGVDLYGEHVLLVDKAGSALHVVRDARAGSCGGVVSTLALGAPPERLHVMGDLALVAAGAAGLIVVDLVDPYAPDPRVLVTLNTPGSALDAASLGGGRFALVADRNGVLVVDVADPGAPAIVGRVRVPDGEVTAVDSAGWTGYFAWSSPDDTTGGLGEVDLACPCPADATCP